MLATRVFFSMSYSAADKALLNAAKDLTDDTVDAMQKALHDGAKIDITDVRPVSESNWIGYKYTALMWAVHNGQIDKVQFLIDKGADANLTTARGNTILHLAAREGHLHVYKLLAELFPDQLSIKGEDDLTPEEIAAKYETKNVAARTRSAALEELPHLPAELWLYVFSFVAPQDLLSLSMACSAFDEIASDDALWRPIARHSSLRLQPDTTGIKELVHLAVTQKQEQKMAAFFTKEKTKQPKHQLEVLESPLSTKTNKALKNVGTGALWTLPIFTYGAGKMIAAKDRGGYLSGLENMFGILIFPWAVIGDLGKAPIMLIYTIVNAARYIAMAPVNLFFGGRDESREEENFYQATRYCLYAAVDGLKQLKLENDVSLAAMSKEGHLQPLMAMIGFLIAYNSLGMNKDTLLINETSLTKQTCPPNLVPFFEKVRKLRNTMKTNLQADSVSAMAENAVKWVPEIWAALKSDEDYTVENKLVQEIVDQLKDLVEMLMKSSVGHIASERITKRMGYTK